MFKVIYRYRGIKLALQNPLFTAKHHAKAVKVMIRIAVCDDVREVVNQVNDFLSEYQEQKKVKLCVNNFYNAEDL